MKKKNPAILLLCLSAFIMMLFTACSAQTISTKKLRDIDFTVVDEDDIPEALEEMIDEKEDKPFKLTYADNGDLYIAVGYGEQPATGYSIQVKELYESENAIYIHTNLIGPAKDEKIIERETKAYIVIKTEFIDKNVVFQ
ncbi:MAG: protease complex subunit PrcB family protein [Tyzzerella sp.]|nr:protease complex subunit PrcB family protein [Tyzzerella sp.]